MLILCGGMPRSGTTWATNVVKDILILQKMQFGLKSPNTPKEVQKEILRFCIGENKILHFHDYCPAINRITHMENIKIFYFYRNPGDIIVSQMQMKQCNFDTSLNMTKNACASFRKILNTKNTNVLSYQRIINDQDNLIFEMSNLLGFVISKEERQKIINNNSFEKNKEHVNNIQRGGGEKIKNRSNERGPSLYDPNTLFNDRHIQNGMVGRWRHELDDEQQKVVNKEFNWYFQYIGEE